MSKLTKSVDINPLKQLRLERNEKLLPLYKEKFSIKEKNAKYIEIKITIGEIKEQYKLERRKLIDSMPEKKGINKLFSGVWTCFMKFILNIVWIWQLTKVRFPKTTEFLVFFMISNAVTVLQLILMPLFKSIFEQTSLINIGFQWGKVGTELGGAPYYMFNYASGLISEGGGGGLGYFLAIQITLAIAQIINFFAQRNITFKATGSVAKAAFWYVLAYVIITLVASLTQGLYKTPIYNFFISTLGWGATGEVVADVVTMIIYSAISFWVFFPIFKLIFKNKPAEKKEG